MASGNEVKLVGNLTRDPEVRYAQSGMAIAKFGLAYNKRKFNKADNDWEEEVHFFDVTCFNTLAENVGESLRKGDRVIVSGSLEQDTWEDKETGDKRSKVAVVADEIAPSLRWASVKITRNERKTDDKPARSQRAAAPSDSNMDDEPF